VIGSPRVHHRVVDSTNRHARELAERGAPHGTLVTADEQTAGRGRQGRAWTAPSRSAVLMSLVLRGLGERHAMLPLAAAVAVCETCETLAGVRCRIKWPNDVRIGGRKIAGVLLEGRPQEAWTVLGIGVNVSMRSQELPAELVGTATSLAASAPDPPADAEQLLAPLIAALARWIDSAPERTLAAWRGRDELRGAAVRWNGGQGVAAGIDESGALLVETDSGRVALDAGEVHLLR
jgi:BirA family transcriptional regulator, biotin operon repressor / biotin---[acetyl-CoA-carboxylase] ligase